MTHMHNGKHAQSTHGSIALVLPANLCVPDQTRAPWRLKSDEAEDLS